MNVGSCFDALQEALRADLDFHGTDGNYSPHSWHPFSAKFPPQLPQFFIERLSDPYNVVFDPMLGSGTTLVEALRLRRRAVGCDIDPLARMIASAKLTPVDPISVLQTGNGIVDMAKCDYWEERDRLERDLVRRFDPKTREFVNYWFLPQQQLELLALIQHIETLPRGGTREFLKVVFSATIIAKSGGVSLARDLAHTRPHKDIRKEPKSAFVEFTKRLERNVAGLAKRDLTVGQGAESQTAVNGAIGVSRSDGTESANPKDSACSVSIRATGADRTGLPSASIDLIVTSPPYANNAIDYMRAHKFSLVWFGWKINDLTKIRAQYLGHDAVSGVRHANLPDQCEETLRILAEADARKALTLRRYFGEMSAVIAEMRRVLKKGRAAVVVVGTSNLRGIDVQTHKGLAAIGESVGFDLAGIGVRRLDRDRRMMPARWGNRRHSQIEERMHEEYVIGMVKP